MMKTMLIGLAMSTLLTTDVNLIPRNGIDMETNHEMHRDILLKYYDTVDIVEENECIAFISYDRGSIKKGKIYFWWK